MDYRKRIILKISGKALKIYLILLFYSSLTTGAGRLSNKILSAQSGVSRKHIYKYIEELERFNLVISFSKGWVRKYKIVTER